MKQVALPLLVAFGLGLPTLPAAWAQQQPEPQAGKLYQQCQERLKQEPGNEEAKKLCDEGMRLLPSSPSARACGLHPATSGGPQATGTMVLAQEFE